MSRENVTARTLINKLTLKSCNAQPTPAQMVQWNKDHPGTVRPLLQIYGQATGFKPGTTDKGEFVKFEGMFKAINMETGEVYESGACILPGAAPSLLAGAIRALGDNGGAVEFAFNIGAAFQETAIRSYEYVIQQVREAGRADPLAALEEKLGVGSPPSNVAQITDASEAKATGTGSKKK